MDTQNLLTGKDFFMNSSTTADCSCRITLDFDLLRRTEVFASAPSDVVKLFAYLAKHRTYQPGESILQQGDKAENCYLIINGQVEIVTAHHDKEIVVQRLHSDSFFGELALLARFDWFFSARTTEETELLIITRESFQKVLTNFPERRDDITEKVIQYRISRFENQTANLLDQLIEAGIYTGDTDQPLIR